MVVSTTQQPSSILIETRCRFLSAIYIAEKITTGVFKQRPLCFMMKQIMGKLTVLKIFKSLNAILFHNLI